MARMLLYADATSNLSNDMKKKALTIACDNCLACLFIKRATKRYNQWVNEELENNPRMPKDGGKVHHAKQEGVTCIQPGKKSMSIPKPPLPERIFVSYFVK